MQNGLASSQGRFAALFHIRAMMRGKIAWLFGGRGGLRLGVAVGFRVARTIRVGHRVAAEVFEVFLHPLDEDDGLLAVGVEQRVGVGEHHHGGVGHIAHGTLDGVDAVTALDALTHRGYP